MSRPTYLVDVDDVLSEYAAEAVRFANAYSGTGLQFTTNDVTGYDIFGSLGCDHLRDRFVQHLIDTDYCLHMPVLDGAREFVEELRSMGDVVFVTYPHPQVPRWAHGRIEWLTREFGADPDNNVILTGAKWRVRGDWLIDDKPENVEAFRAGHGNAILFDRPWNKEPIGGLRAFTYRQVIELIKDHTL